MNTQSDECFLAYVHFQGDRPSSGPAILNPSKSFHVIFKSAFLVGGKVHAGAPLLGVIG